MTRQPLSGALGLAAALALATSSQATADPREDAALTALVRLAENPNAPQPDPLSEFGFHEATYLVDGLTRT